MQISFYLEFCNFFFNIKRSLSGIAGARDLFALADLLLNIGAGAGVQKLPLSLSLSLLFGTQVCGLEQVKVVESLEPASHAGLLGRLQTPWQSLLGCVLRPWVVNALVNSVILKSRFSKHA